jgi:Na+-translocating ferredoxin:NAD+ oxidoreductase RnfC subunit
MSKPEIEIIKNAGVVGAGGAGFPAYIKYDTTVDTFIVNAAECEPLIDVDKLILQNYFEKVYEGINAVAGLIAPERIVIALKAKYKKAIESIENFKIQPGGSAFEIFRLENFYPAGDEQVLVYEVTGKIVPEGSIPLSVGTVVSNVETLFNVSNALKNIPVTEKFITVNGRVDKPQTIKVPIGTPVKVILDYCGIDRSGDYKVLDGGPMMGKIVDEDDYAVKKTTKSLLVLSSETIVMAQKLRSQTNQVKRAQAICLSCRMCTDLCPRYLLGHYLFPDELMKKLYKGTLEDDELEKFDFAYLCCDCGLCELYSCPVDLSPRSLFNYIKSRLGQMQIKNTHNRKDLEVNEFRNYRRVPIDRLLTRIEVDGFDKKTELSEFTIQPDFVRLYLQQHIGARSVPVVNKGDEVARGQLVASIPEGKTGSNIHSSINGVVSEIGDEFIIVSRQARSST